MKKFFVGRTDSQPVPKEVSGLNRPVKQRRFQTHDQALAFIENVLRKHDQQGVDRGQYYLDAPEM